jgi:hypothetical protein
MQKSKNYEMLWAGVSMIAIALSAPNLNAETAASMAVKTQAAIGRGHPPEWWNPQLPEEVLRDVTGKGTRLASQLELNDEAKTQKVEALITEHFSRVWAWHQKVDAKLDAAWREWDAARDNTNGKQKDELKALAIATEKIDPIHAEFAPQTHGFLSALRNEVGEEKTIALMDRITRSPGAKRTFDAYVGMVPEMTGEQKAILWERMVQAREDCMAAWSDKQIIKIFKKYKLRNEFSIDYFGYGYQKRYQEWAAAGAKPKE